MKKEAKKSLSATDSREATIATVILCAPSTKLASQLGIQALVTE